MQQITQSCIIVNKSVITDDTPENEAAQVLIPESAVQDLTYIDLKGHRYHFFKRVFDLVFSCLGLALLFIPFLIIATAIYVDNPGKIFFTQNRVGRDGKMFKLFKFRTMHMTAPQYSPTNELKDPDQYITRFGHFLRNTSLDELPQLINVIRGEMSLVGPRPLIPEESEIHEMRTRFGVYAIRPGITGLAQINGRDVVSAVKKVRMDVAYLRQFGLLMDLRILMATIPKLAGDKNVVEGFDANNDNLTVE